MVARSCSVLGCPIILARVPRLLLAVCLEHPLHTHPKSKENIIPQQPTPPGHDQHPQRKPDNRWEGQYAEAADGTPASFAQRFRTLPRRTQLAIAALLSLALLTVLQTLLHKDYREAAYLDSYGSLVASQLARLSQDAMAREDAIALNVLAEQVAAEPAILHIEIYSMDGATLASYSSPQVTPQSFPETNSTTSSEPSAGPSPVGHGQEFTRPIQLADATAGFVMVVVANDALQQSHNDYQLQEALRFAAAIALSAATIGFLIAVVTGSPRRNSARAKAAAALTNKSDSTETDFYLLLAYLFNGNDMSPTRRDALLASAHSHANSVAQLYQGRVQQVSPTAVAIVFDEIDTPERSFQIACAALVLSRLGNQPGGARYRYSLQNLHLQHGVESLLDSSADDAREDALLHAALAEDNAVALAADFARQLPRSERLELTSEHSPTLAALDADASRDYYLMSSANPATEAILLKQLAALRSPSL